MHIDFRYKKPSSSISALRKPFFIGALEALLLAYYGVFNGGSIHCRGGGTAASFPKIFSIVFKYSDKLKCYISFHSETKSQYFLFFFSKANRLARFIIAQSQNEVGNSD